MNCTMPEAARITRSVIQKSLPPREFCQFRYRLPVKMVKLLIGYQVNSLFSCFEVPAHLLMRGHPQKAPAASHENRSYPRLLDFATGSKIYPRHPTVGCWYISHTRQYTVPKIGDVQRTLSGIGSRSTGTTLTIESCTRTTGTSN